MKKTANKRKAAVTNKTAQRKSLGESKARVSQDLSSVHQMLLQKSDASHADALPVIESVEQVNGQTFAVAPWYANLQYIGRGAYGMVA